MSVPTDIALTQTDFFIQENPELVRFSRTPTPLEGDGEGGVKRGAPGTVAEQTVRFVQPTDKTVRTSLEGEEVETVYMIVGYPDLDVERGDWFWRNGEKCEVSHIALRTDYIVYAEVFSRG